MKIGKIQLPEKKKLTGKTSIVPKILSMIPKGEMATIIDKETTTIEGKEYKLNISSIRGYIKKRQIKGELTQYTIQSETFIDHTQPNHKNQKLYIAHDTAKPDKKQEK